MQYFSLLTKYIKLIAMDVSHMCLQGYEITNKYVQVLAFVTNPVTQSNNPQYQVDWTLVVAYSHTGIINKKTVIITNISCFAYYEIIGHSN
jgi:hypothetical protein